MRDFLHFWQHLPSHLDPVIFSIGAFHVHYYGLMYLVAFGVTYWLVRHRLKTESGFQLTPEGLESLATMMIAGVIIGGRLGYVIFYNFSHYLSHPLEIFLPFDFSDGIRFTGISGMSYHGGLLGVIMAGAVFSRRGGIRFTELMDLFAPVVPLGYTFGRLGNFINGELYGRITQSPVGMFFSSAPGPMRRHPSQLYEAFFEGVFLFLVLWGLRKKVRTPGAMLALYLAGYGFVRFFIEYFREPDAHLGAVWMGLTMGQLLCAGMMAGGAVLWMGLYRKAKRGTS